jgi:hypothetical protein
MRLFSLIFSLVTASMIPVTVLAEEPLVSLYMTESPEFNVGSQRGHHVIAPGETLLGILREHYSGSVDIPHLIEQVVGDNQQAFRQGNADMMIAGQALILRPHDLGPPEPDDIYFF